MPILGYQESQKERVKEMKNLAKPILMLLMVFSGLIGIGGNLAFALHPEFKTLAVGLALLIVSLSLRPQKHRKDEVLNYITSPEHAPEWIANLTRVKGISTKTPSVGQSWFWEYSLLGMKVLGRTKVREFSSRRYVKETEGSIVSTCVFTLEIENGGTRINLEMDYVFAGSIFYNIAGRSKIEKMKEDAVQQTLERVKAILESRYSTEMNLAVEGSLGEKEWGDEIRLDGEESESMPGSLLRGTSADADIAIAQI